MAENRPQSIDSIGARKNGYSITTEEKILSLYDEEEEDGTVGSDQRLSLTLMDDGKKWVEAQTLKCRASSSNEPYSPAS